MADDIRDVSQTTPFAPLRGVTRSSAQERQSDEEKGAGGEGRYAGEEDSGSGGNDAAAAGRLAAQVEAANARLAAHGIKVRLRLAAGRREQAVEVLLVGAGGTEVVSRRMPASEIPAWIAHIETSEGLLLDDTL